MPKGNNYTALPTEAQLAEVIAAAKALEQKLNAVVPQQPNDLLTSATITPERLPLADLALQVADKEPNIIRRATDIEQFRAKLALYRQLNSLLGDLQTKGTRLENALNVLGSDLVFAANNIHEDVEKDNGETADLGQLRQDLHAYYERPNARKEKQQPSA